MVMTALAAGALQSLGHFVEADRAVAVLVELGEYVVGRLEIGAAGAERVLEFGFGDLAVAIGVDLREQVLHRVGGAGGRRRRGRSRRGLALGLDQRTHDLRRYLRTAAAGTRARSGRSLGAAARLFERIGGGLRETRGRRGRPRGLRRLQRLEGIARRGRLRIPLSLPRRPRVSRRPPPIRSNSRAAAPRLR